MCERKTRKFVCNRCSNYIFVEDPQPVKRKKTTNPAAISTNSTSSNANPPSAPAAPLSHPTALSPSSVPLTSHPWTAATLCFAAESFFYIPAITLRKKQITLRKKQEAVMKGTGVQQPL